jgi:alpha-glucosidase
MTTTEVRKRDFNIVVAVGTDQKATGQLYLDDGVSLVQASMSVINFDFDGREFKMTGSYGFKTSSKIATVTVLGLSRVPEQAQGLGYARESGNGVATVTVNVPLTRDFTFGLDFH